METLKYTIIKSKDQYTRYCDILEKLVLKDEVKYQDEVELLTLLIEQWDKENNTFSDSDPVELLKTLMDEKGLKAKDLVGILDLSKGTISKILNYNKGFSKESIRKLSEYFKVSQEAFNRSYKLMNAAAANFKVQV
jgi:HTH-type transcriptional regulator / antitoxin HigA